MTLQRVHLKLLGVLCLDDVWFFLVTGIFWKGMSCTSLPTAIAVVRLFSRLSLNTQLSGFPR